MALQGAIPVEFGEAFAHGCFAVGEVEAVRDFERSSKDTFVQAVDRDSGLLWWSIDVLDGDPAAREKLVRVKLAAAVKPVPPAQVDGVPFRPVELDGLAVVPYVVTTTGSGRARLAYSFRAKGLRAPGPRSVKAAAS
ncbi:MAG: plasmid replication, integration and excision activator [Acidimicrobiales bacterium]